MFFCHRCELPVDAKIEFKLYLFIGQPQYNAVTCVCPLCKRICAVFIDPTQCVDAWLKGAKVWVREVPTEDIRGYYEQMERMNEDRQRFNTVWERRIQ